MALCDVFLPGLDEAQSLCGKQDVAAIIDWCAALGVRQVVLKCGAQGAWVWQQASGAAQHVSALKVDAIDATGAGDCFDGALVARLALGDDLLDAVRYANVAAALSTTGYGAVAPIPRQEEVLMRVIKKLMV